MSDGRIFTPLRVFCAFASGVVLHVLFATLLSAFVVGAGMELLLFGSFLAWIPFVGVGVWVAARRPEPHVVLRWAFAGVPAVPIVWIVDAAIVVVLLLMGYGSFHL